VPVRAKVTKNLIHEMRLVIVNGFAENRGSLVE
jgi:hypothetical protein